MGKASRRRQATSPRPAEGQRGFESEVERLRRENERLRRELAERERELAERERELAEREKQVADLERQLGLRHLNSVTSSKPPSSDGLAGKQRDRCRARRVGGRRKPGGQPGHRGHWRGLVPPERVDEVTALYPLRCCRCERTFSGRERREQQSEPRRHQVAELPPVQAHITEYQCHEVRCSGCGAATRAALPDGVRGHFGPRLAALIAYQTVTCRMPRRVVLDSLEHVLGIGLSLGSVQKIWEEASQAVAEPCGELARQLPHEPVVTAMRPATGPAGKNAGCGRWWLPRLCSTK